MAMVALHRDHLDPEAIDATLGCILKHADDIDLFRAKGFAAAWSGA